MAVSPLPIGCIVRGREVANRQNCDLGRSFNAHFTKQFGSTPEQSLDRDVLAFRELVKPYLQGLEIRGRLVNTDETLDIVSAILEHHISKTFGKKGAD